MHSRAYEADDHMQTGCSGVESAQPTVPPRVLRQETPALPQPPTARLDDLIARNSVHC